MKVLNEKTVRSRTHHRCSACLRIFSAGAMIRKVTVLYDGLSTWKECPTCAELLRKAPKMFDDGSGIFEYGCVDASLNQGQTPEMLLAELSYFESNDL